MNIPFYRNFHCQTNEDHRSEATYPNNGAHTVIFDFGSTLLPVSPLTYTEERGAVAT